MSGVNRRDFLIKAGATGAVALGIAQVTAESRPARTGSGAAAAGAPAAGHAHGAAAPVADPAPAAPVTRVPGGTVTTLEAFRDPLRIPPRIRGYRADGTTQLTIRMRPLWTRLHSQLPPSYLWGYEGQFPGPVIEARRGQRLRITWVNELSGRYPLPVVEVPFDENADPFQWDVPGREGVEPRADVAALPPWTSVHLHGAFSNGSSDGWAEDAILPGNGQPAEYANDQPATALWYHDHAMHITRWNVMSGLLGMYLLRDDEEAALRLPAGDREVPLILCDRNFDTDSAGRLTGTVLHKTTVMRTEPLRQVRSFAGPYTLVNGTVWPHLDVAPGWYRFRMLNASNTRPYTVRLVGEDGNPLPAGTIFVIGTDSGLLAAPVDVRDGFGLAAAERADVLIDFRALAGRKLRLRNVDYDPGPWPEFLEFRVGTRRTAESFTLPPRLSRSFARVTAEAVRDRPERMVMLTPVGVSHARMWEMTRIDPPAGPGPVDGVVQVREKDGSVTTWRRLAYRWSDPVQYAAETGGWERWRFLNLDYSGWPHPMHLHVSAFQPLSREFYDIDGFQFLDLPGGGIGGGTAKPVAFKETQPIAPAEQGWKDVITVAAGECVDLAVKFTEVSGKFVYHCHMFEHEDMSMMRPFLVQPRQVLAIARSMEHELGHGQH
ncbi:multicopper oxidase family protein [Amycolatopsis anabasis]|uniref:multicopper oxidase family protein n=1 Tax=Amycolatopsis anabasis TaxID=1840409 RepID=UPI001FE74CB3|nr:multicopper oxidase domain-containing protein [Amycolatopsis anabasis]